MRIGLGLSPVVRAGGSAAVAETDPFTLASWKAAFWASDPDWTSPGDGNAIVAWRDGGAEAKDISGSNATFRASVAAFGNKPAIQFAGSGSLSSASWTAAIAAASTVTFVAVATATAAATQAIVANTANSAFFTGRAASNYALYRGGGGDQQGTPDSNAHLHVATIVGSAGAGVLEVDGTQVLSVAGTGSATMVSVIVGNQFYSFTNHFLTGHVAFAAVLDGAISAPERAAVEAWAADFYGLTI